MMKTISLTLAGDPTMGEYIVSSPSRPLYAATLDTCPIEVCGETRSGAMDVAQYVEGPADHLQPIWTAVMHSGHFLRAQFGRNGVITLWAGGSTAPCDVEEALLSASHYLPGGTTVRLANAS